MWRDWYFSWLREKNKDIKIQQPFFILILSTEHRVPAIPAGSTTEEFKSTKQLGISLAIKAQLTQTCFETMNWFQIVLQEV